MFQNKVSFSLKALLAILGILAFSVTPATVHATTSSSVAYVTDFGTGICDTSGPGSGSSVLENAVTGSVPAGCFTGGPKTYTTGVNPFLTTALGTTVTFTDVAVSAVDAGGLATLLPFDTVLLYQVCDIGSHPATLTALNSYLTGGHGKLILLDGDRCAKIAAGDAVYTGFLFPFTSSDPGPSGFISTTTFQESESPPATLSRSIPVGTGSGTDAVGDSNTITTKNPAWCEAIGGTNGLGITGAQLAYVTSASSGGVIPVTSLLIWNGWDQWFTFGANKPDAQAFDNMLDQSVNPDNLPCKVVISHGAPEFPLGLLAMVGLLVPAMLLLKRRIIANPLAR